MTTFPIVNYRQRAVLSAAIIFSVVPTAAVLLRVIARRISARALNLSDYCAIVAAVLTIALEAISIAAVVHCGLAYGHASEIVAQFGSTPVVTLLKLVIPLQFLWTLSLGFSKTSILLLYSQLFKTEHYLVVAARVTIAIHVLRMSICKKLALVAVFSLGLLTCVTSVIRLVCLTQMDFTDLPYSFTLASIFGGLEPSMAVTLACIPLFRPLVGRCKYRAGDNLGSRVPRREQFEPLGDDAGGEQLRLRPLGFKHQAEVSAVSVGNGSSDERRDDREVEAKVDSGHTPGILVSREWEVTR
ncbi:hypothetical protein INS49_014676 [Diaporthe citri]|uniref:uncharacterized protein n=1 Tax=Diaporthe citri TaxID=83186 RepID=UPI001C7E28BB|nr:uncharacterized protein INS49_014676 [Diaporthe citri]KAG6356802.1 hypothetical protein INS49_014676 [Diaporthe citri]